MSEITRIPDRRTPEKREEIQALVNSNLGRWVQIKTEDLADLLADIKSQVVLVEALTKIATDPAFCPLVGIAQAALAEIGETE